MTGPEKSPQALAGIKVIDFSRGVAGQFCSRLLCDYGADVVLIEPPGGTPTRRRGPEFASGSDAEGGDSALFLHLNTGKSSRTLEVFEAPRLEQLDELLSDVDVIVDDGLLDGEAMLARHPRAVVVRISEFGAGVDERAVCGGKPDEMIHQALSGIMYNNGVPGRRPLFGVGDRISYVAGIAAYTGALSALFAREQGRGIHRSGLGQLVDIAVAEVAASMSYNQANQYLQNGTFDGRWDRYTPETILRCRDGWAGIFPYSDRWELVCTVLGAKHLLSDPRFATPEERQRRWREVDEELEAVTIRMTMEEVVGRLREARQVAAPSITPTALHRSPHLAARGFWGEIDVADVAVPVLGPPFRMSHTPRAPLRASPPRVGAEKEAAT